MNKSARFLRPLMPILAAVYGTAIIYVTAMPVAGDNLGFLGELLTWLSGSRRTVFQADGHLPLPPSPRTDRHLCGDGLPVRNTPRAQLPGSFYQRPVLRDGVYLVAKHLV